MDQIKTGKFIAERRKAKNLTQRELADKLLVSDKTVSKWETGRGLPEVSLMVPLCEILEINVNELLTGEVIDSAAYQKHAEENMMKLIDEHKENKRKLILETIIVFITLLASTTIIMVAGYADLTSPIRILLIVIALAVMVGGIAVAATLEMTSGCFECPKCGHYFMPTKTAYLMGMHTIMRRQLRCPKCGKRSWCIRRLSKPEQPEE